MAEEIVEEREIVINFAIHLAYNVYENGMSAAEAKQEQVDRIQGKINMALLYENVDINLISVNQI